MLDSYKIKPDGAVAQLGERLNGIQEADGSIPFSSTIFFQIQRGERSDRQADGRTESESTRSNRTDSHRVRSRSAPPTYLPEFLCLIPCMSSGAKQLVH